MSSISKTGLRLILVATFIGACSHANAGLFSDDEARKAILELRSKLETSQREMRDANTQFENKLDAKLDAKSDKNSALDLINQNEQMRQEVAKLRGQIEVLTNELSNAQRRQKDFYVDLDNRLRKLEPIKINVDGKEASVEPGEQKSYDAALALFKTGDFKGAGTAFADFILRYPESAHAASAQYWLGNAYYAQRDYKNAIASQQLLLKNYPNSPKAADAVLNIASCYTELKDKASAKSTLEHLITQYPESGASKIAKTRLDAMQ
ncbi:MAG: tol-pal system protein YbgF [Pseudomonadota bacterium]